MRYVVTALVGVVVLVLIVALWLIANLVFEVVLLLYAPALDVPGATLIPVIIVWTLAAVLGAWAWKRGLGTQRRRKATEAARRHRDATRPAPYVRARGDVSRPSSS